MFQQYFTLWGMTLTAAILELFFYFSRRTRYSISCSELFAIILIIGIGSPVGASLASIIVQGYASGKRAYGMILLTTMLLLPYAAYRKSKDGRLTDYAALPALSICCAGKIQCCFDHCCYGIALFETESGKIIRFPSEILETITLFAMLFWLLDLERKEKAKSFLWPLYALWYGITRYVADLFRGNPKELKAFLFGIRPGQFWSIVIILMGFWLLGKAFKRKYGRDLEGKELLQAIIGKFPET